MIRTAIAIAVLLGTALTPYAGLPAARAQHGATRPAPQDVLARPHAAHPVVTHAALDAASAVAVDDQPIRIVQQVGSDEAGWDDSFQTSITYDANGLRVRDLAEAWDDNAGGWTNAQQVHYTYEDGRLTVMLAESWDAEAAAWTPGFRMTVSYGDGGAAETMLQSVYMDGAWTPVFRSVYAYADGLLAENVMERALIPGEPLEVYARYVITHVGNDQVSEYQSRGDGADQWTTEGRITTYDTQATGDFQWFELTQPDILSEIWDAAAGAWVNEFRITTTEDAAGLPSVQDTEVWSVDQGSWVPDARTTFTHEAGRLTAATELQWEDEAWTQTARSLYQYEGETGTAVEGAGVPSGFSLEPNYPNPFNPSTTIRFSVPASQHVSLKVYDATGREVATLVDGITAGGAHTAAFEAAGLPSGLYVYRLRTASFEETRAMLLVK